MDEASPKGWSQFSAFPSVLGQYLLSEATDTVCGLYKKTCSINPTRFSFQRSGERKLREDQWTQVH